MTKRSLELDVKIASLLGWEHVKMQYGAYEQFRYEYALPGRMTYYTLTDGDDTFEGVDLPEFSGDVGIALTLWDTIPDEFTPRLVRMLTPVDGQMQHEYKAGILRVGDDFLNIEERAETPAMAICRVWLKWKQGE